MVWFSLICGILFLGLWANFILSVGLFSLNCGQISYDVWHNCGLMFLELPAISWNRALLFLALWPIVIAPRVSVTGAVPYPKYNSVSTTFPGAIFLVFFW